MSSEFEIEEAVTACRHLLRYLDRPAALAANPIYRSSLDPDIPLHRVRDALRASAMHLNERDRAILLRCDVAHEPHKKVAFELGLSMRQFYRDRAAMISRLAAVMSRRRRRATRDDVAAIAVHCLAG